ncbi:hypothetical protein [Marinobacterium aestuariivivens]|uniref:FAD dependent oxidoreductase domain-containing protein n=1 Tax=Marinobacterium aestuariivivens TaxID=1698799 RepID=A0ABW1ZU82_9GAMM
MIEQQKCKAGIGMTLPQNAPCALVVGLCSHGLAIARSLQRLGVEVHAFEANSAIPGALTNSAVIHYVESIKDDSLVDNLLAFRERIPSSRDIVLFPSNDNNVRVIARHIGRLRGHLSSVGKAASIRSRNFCSRATSKVGAKK